MPEICLILNGAVLVTAVALHVWWWQRYREMHRRIVRRSIRAEQSAATCRSYVNQCYQIAVKPRG